MRVTQITELSGSRSKIYIEQVLAFVLYQGEIYLHGIREGEEIEEAQYHQIMDEVLPRRAKLRCMNLLKHRDYTEAQLREKLRQGYYPQGIIDRTIEYAASFHYINDYRYAANYIAFYAASKSKKRIDQELWRKGIGKEILENAWLERENRRNADSGDKDGSHSDDSGGDSNGSDGDSSSSDGSGGHKSGGDSKSSNGGSGCRDGSHRNHCGDGYGNADRNRVGGDKREAYDRRREEETAMMRELLSKKRYQPETADEKEKRRVYSFLVRKGFSRAEAAKVMRLPLEEALSPP
ncbi:MAG: RecX family transcriptional regulator [Clostridium sp.]|jgi:regulatory protein|nr:RecX family transcriptional regulator [Clostridium sp.]